MATSETGPPARAWIARAFSAVEDLVYIGLGVILAACAIVLLGYTFLGFGRSLLAGTLPSNITTLLDRILLILLQRQRIPGPDVHPNARPFTSMSLAIGTRERRVIGGMVAKACQVCKPLQFGALLSRGDHVQFPDVSTVAKPSRPATTSSEQRAYFGMVVAVLDCPVLVQNGLHTENSYAIP